jgi:hypothetical protein
MEDYYAKCGVNCGRCVLYVENLTDDKREWIAQGMRYVNWHPKPEILRACAGCQTEEGFHYLPKCQVRQCAQYNQLETCADCGIFPCREVPRVSLSTDYRERAEERLGEPIPEEDYLVFIEPHEGIKHLKAIRAGISPQDLVPPKKVLPLRTRVAPFISGESHSCWNLYNLMTKILRGEADIYVRQALLKKRRNVVLFTLWIFGRYGEFAEDGDATLVITDAVSETSTDPGHLIRKRDNTLHQYGSAELLVDFDLHLQHIPLDKKRWLLKLTAGESIGGLNTLRALKAYVTALVEKYGETKYAGSYKLKGEAYTYFKKADMDICV